MSGVNWALGLQQGPNPGEAFNNAFQQGIKMNEQRAARNAMGTLVQNPNDPQALAALAKLDPSTAMQFRQQQAQLAHQQLLQHQDSILKGGEIIRQMRPHDQASWTQALQAAQAAGVDISQVPQVWNEQTQQYAGSLVSIADALKPQPSTESVVPLQGGGAAGVYDKATGTFRMLVAPNPGDQQPGTSVAGGNVPPQAAVDYLKANPGLAADFDQKYGPGTAARILGNGGQAATPPATFPQYYGGN